MTLPLRSLAIAAINGNVEAQLAIPNVAESVLSLAAGKPQYYRVWCAITHLLHEVIDEVERKSKGGS